jgi:hypothetical protein
MRIKILDFSSERASSWELLVDLFTILRVGSNDINQTRDGNTMSQLNMCHSCKCVKVCIFD